LVGFNDDRAFELNEIGWWEQWAHVTWLNEDTYVLHSDEFDEYFFNRAGFTRVTGSSVTLLESIESEFEKRRRVPQIFVQQGHPRLSRSLTESAYRIIDKMVVMEMSTPSITVNPDVKLEVGTSVGLEDWAETYLKAFYGETELDKMVVRVLRRVLKIKECSLVLARIGGDPAGCLALFRSKALCGIYCVGTQPDFRRMNVASTMLGYACRLAMDEERRVILQTILSDSLQDFYNNLGFRTAYLKDLFVKNPVDCRK